LSKNFKIAAGLILLFISIISITIFLFYKGYLRCNYPSRNDYPIQGIDISHYQGKINWQQLKQENLDFVIIKATEGNDFVDHKFTENADSAIAHGYKVGAYHFYRLCRDGKKQAQHFINTTQQFALAIPPTVDLEFGGNCKGNQTKSQILRQIGEYLDTLESVYGTPPIIYATAEFYNEYIAGHFQRNPIWIRDIFRKPELKDKRDWKIWQFANRGRLKGISTYIDINAFSGKTIEF
jgi:lysozyme